MAKQYGLIKAGKSNTSAPVLQRPSIFGNDSDSDNEIKKPTGITKTVKRQDKVLQTKALAEDPTVFQYDELYDEMDTKRKESKLVRKDLDKKPKYISRLLVTAERRKRENERRIERQVQKEREEEGNQYKDKEEFVTSGYRKKLEELKELEEAEKREEYLESIGDVRKQGDLSGFYRHLYEQKVNFEDKKESATIKTEVKSRSASPLEEIAADDKEECKEKEIVEKKTPAKRKYRKRDNSASEEEKAEEDVKKLEHLPSNLDADSDFSIDSDDTDDEETAKKPKTDDALVQEVKKETDAEVIENKKQSTETKNDSAKKEDPKSEEEIKKEKVECEVKKPKIDIWKKRTVGVVFDEALQRYFERKAIRESSAA